MFCIHLKESVQIFFIQKFEVSSGYLDLKKFQDLERLYGTLSMEYFEKITGQSERFRRELDHASSKFTDRKDMWRSCVQKRDDFVRRRTSLLVWLAAAEGRMSSLKSNEASEIGKGITDLALLAKEIASRTSPEDAATIQAQVKHQFVYLPLAKV